MQTIPERETLTVEFKCDQKCGLPDHDLVLAVVCLANAEGGAIYLAMAVMKKLVERYRSLMRAAAKLS